MPDGLTAVAIVVLLVSAPVAGWLALQRDRPPVAWFVFGALSGPLAIGVLLLAPPGHCPRCDTTVTGWPEICTTCGWRLRGRDAPPDASLPVSEPSERPPAGAVEAPAPPLSPDTARPMGLWRRVARAPDPIVDLSPSELDAVAGRPPPLPAVDAGAASASDHHGERIPQIVVTGIFTGGSAHLEIGLRYGLARDEDTLVTLGPLDRTPNEIRASLPIESVDVLSVEDRVTVVSRGDRRERLLMGFISAAGLRGRDLEEAMASVAAGVAVAES